MKLARLSRLPGHREGRVIQRRTQKTGIGSQLLTRAAGREELEKRRHFAPRSNDFLHSGDRDVHRRKKAAHANVAFALNQHQRAGVSRNQVRAGDANVGPQELFAQPLAREFRQLFSRVQRQIRLKLALEERRDPFPAVMDRRRYDVRWLLVRELQDEFRKVAFSHLDPC